MGWHGSGGDDTAIHDDVAGEISAITEKSTPVNADLVIIEDSEASNAKKKVQVGNLGGGGAEGYAANIGNASDTSISLAHPLNSTDVIVQCFESGEQVFPDIDVASAGQIDFTFSSAPGTDAIRVVILKFGSTPAWTLPTTNLILHLDAEMLGLSDNDAVATWTDESGESNDASQGTGANQPTYKTGIVNGLAVVRFVTNDYMTLGNLFSGATEGEIFVVAENDSDPGGSGNGVIKFGSSGDASHHPWTTGDVYSSFGSTARKNTGDPTPSLASWHLLNIESAASDWKMRINNASHYTTTSNTVGWKSAPVIGAGETNSYHYNGDIAAVIAYDAVLSDADRTAVVNYLNDRFNLGL